MAQPLIEQEFEQLPMMLQCMTQLCVQSFTMQWPWPLHCTVHPFPAQLSSMFPVPSAVAVQLPASQVKVQFPVPLHWKSHPGPSQIFSQLPVPLHTQLSPALQAPTSFPLLRQAAWNRIGTAARRQAGRRIFFMVSSSCNGCICGTNVSLFIHRGTV
jgi:hypothetical protein